MRCRQPHQQKSPKGKSELYLLQHKIYEEDSELPIEAVQDESDEAKSDQQMRGYPQGNAQKVHGLLEYYLLQCYLLHQQPTRKFEVSVNRN